MTAPVSPMPFTKGHGTENDFIVLPDPDGELALDDSLVRRLCDRRAGIGADGVIRVVRAARVSEALPGSIDGARWFMDYRNADGTVAEMCGNGARVFAAYLLRERLVEGPVFTIATRAGLKRISVDGDQIAVNLGPWRLVDNERFAAEGHDTLVAVRGMDPLPGLSLDLGNPHTVVALPDSIELMGLDLTVAPHVNPRPPHGTNIELAQPLGPGHLQMRVHERGVGETRSCGTGAAATALAFMLWSGTPDDNRAWRVDLPGGTVHVRALPSGEVELSGPARLIADGYVDLS